MSKLNRLDLLDKEDEIKKELTSIVDGAEGANRHLTEIENDKFMELTKELEEVRKALVNTEEKNINNIKKEVVMEKIIDMNLLKVLKEKRNNTVSAESQAVLEAGRDEARKAGIDIKGDILIPVGETRAINVATEEGGHAAVATEKLDILTPLVNELVLVKAGARVLNGLTGDINIPSLGDISATWESETAETAGQSPTFSSVELKPKRLSVVIPVSNTWFEQDSVGASQALNQLIMDKIRIKLEETALGVAAETAGKIPAGLLNGAVAKGDMTFKGIVAMEGDCLEANVNPNAYIVHPKLMVKAKTTPMDAGSGRFVYENGQMNGYPVYSTNSVAKGMATAKDEYGILMGDFSQFYVAFWNGLGITMDPYTLAASNQTRLIVNFYVDFKNVRPEAIVAQSMK